MKYILMLVSFVVFASALPVYEQPIDDPQKYKNIEILILESAVDQDGGYSFSFENDDGSRVSQEGKHKIIDDEHAVESIRGSYSYNDVNGQPISLTYTADENGFRPFGAHLPTPPPTPPEILRSLRFLATAKPFVDEQLYDYKPIKKVFRGRQYSTRNPVTRSRNSLRSTTFSEVLTNNPPRELLLKSAEGLQDSKTEATSETMAQVSQKTENKDEAETTEKTENTEKPRSTVDVLNESKKNIYDALKESIEKTTKLTQSATDETVSVAAAAIREEAAKLTEKVKLQVSKLNEKLSVASAKSDEEVSVPAKESRQLIDKYTGIVLDSVSTADETLVETQ